MANENELSASLLTIGQDLDIINGIVVGSDADQGMHFAYIEIGDRGEMLVTKINTNFHAIDSEFLYMATEISKRIKSDQIKEIKKENGHLYYTENGNTWVQLDGTTWGQITGTISSQTDLKSALDAKANDVEFKALVTTVDGHTTNINSLLSSVATLTSNVKNIDSRVTGNTNDISSLNVTLITKIGSPTIQQIRQRADVPNNLEYTVDGQHWIPLLGEQNVVSWGEIQGDINNQLDLVNLVKGYLTEEELNTILQDYTLNSNFEILNTTVVNLSNKLTTHINSQSNPHSVTKSQIGLGNVDNTSDMSKPVSTAQQSYIDNAVSGSIKGFNVTRICVGSAEDYEDSKDELGSDYLYVVLD